MNLTGYKTVIVAIVTLLIGLATAAGYTIPDGSRDWIVTQVDLVIGGVTALYSLVMFALRIVTYTPVGVASLEGAIAPGGHDFAPDPSLALRDFRTSPDETSFETTPGADVQRPAERSAPGREFN